MKHKVTTNDLVLFCQDQYDRYQEYRRTYGFTSSIHDEMFDWTLGPKFARIIANRSEGAGSHVVCFIDMTTGNIHKADGWKKPCTTGATKGVRGNIFTEDRGASCMTPHGTRYLK